MQQPLADRGGEAEDAPDRDVAGCEDAHRHVRPLGTAAVPQHAGDPQDSGVTVRLLNGRGVIEELYIGGKPVREFLREQKR